MKNQTQKNSESTLEDSVAAYFSNPSYAHFINNPLQVSELIENGLPYHFFAIVSKNIPFNEEEWAEILNISTKSLQRYRLDKSFLFKPIHAEKIMEITEVSFLGIEVFGDINKFKTWLKSENFALGNHKPQELLRNSYGKELVVNELNRIQYGIFA